mgnify:CR=1 FL=1
MTSTCVIDLVDSGIQICITSVSGTESLSEFDRSATVYSDAGVPDAILLDRGFIAKNGAEGVFVVGTREGYGVCVKIADGNLRAAPLVAIKLMHENGVLGDTEYSQLKELLAVPSLGGGIPQGELIAL